MSSSGHTVEKIVNYVVIIIVLTVGALVLAGVFRIDSRIRLPFGMVIVLYGIVRLVTMSRKSRSYENEKNA